MVCYGRGVIPIFLPIIGNMINSIYKLVENLEKPSSMAKISKILYFTYFDTFWKSYSGITFYAVL